MEFKAHFKLEFDIKTNSDNMAQILKIIGDNITNEFENNVIDYTEMEVKPTMTVIQIPCFSKKFEDNDGNTRCSKCGDKVEGGYCSCYKVGDTCE